MIRAEQGLATASNSNALSEGWRHEHHKGPCRRIVSSWGPFDPGGHASGILQPITPLRRPDTPPSTPQVWTLDRDPPTARCRRLQGRRHRGLETGQEMPSSAATKKSMRDASALHEAWSPTRIGVFVSNAHRGATTPIMSQAGWRTRARGARLSTGVVLRRVHVQRCLCVCACRGNPPLIESCWPRRPLACPGARS